MVTSSPGHTIDLCDSSNTIAKFPNSLLQSEAVKFVKTSGPSLIWMEKGQRDPPASASLFGPREPRAATTIKQVLLFVFENVMTFLSLNVRFQYSRRSQRHCVLPATLSRCSLMTGRFADGKRWYVCIGYAQVGKVDEAIAIDILPDLVLIDGAGQSGNRFIDNT